MSRLIEIAASRGLVQETDVSEVRDLQRLRNVLVHSAETPDDARARPLVEKALELIERLKAPPPAKPRRARS
ncbi:MAG TPA: hypothetical protein VN213_00465 [Solirubrobacteraceae bacterium]|nr:hypothetical protein [Solirubrobacteraceae bacterium]